MRTSSLDTQRTLSKYYIQSITSANITCPFRLKISIDMWITRILHNTFSMCSLSCFSYYCIEMCRDCGHRLVALVYVARCVDIT